MLPLTIGLIIGSKPLYDGVQEVLRETPVRVVLEQSDVRDWQQLAARVGETRPELLIIDLDLITGPLDAVFGLLRQLPTAAAIAPLKLDASPDVILEAMRAGASDFVYTPIETTLTRALSRLSDQRQEQQRSGHRRGGKIFGFFSAKGGCGATTFACHLGLEMPRQAGGHALLMDLDLDSGLVGFLMKAASEYSVLDAAKNLRRLDLSFWKKIVSNGNPGLEILSAPVGAAAADSLNGDHIRQIFDFARSYYEHSVVDLGRGLGQNVFAALETVDEACLITTMDVPALHQARTLTQRLLDSGFSRDRLKLIVNRMPKNPELTVDELERAIAFPIFATAPADDEALRDAYSEGNPLPPESALRRQIGVIARRLAGIPEVKPKKRFLLFN